MYYQHQANKCKFKIVESGQTQELDCNW